MTKQIVLLHTDLPWIYRWTREGRHGQACRILSRAQDGECLVEFADGHRMVTNRKSLRRQKMGDKKADA